MHVDVDEAPPAEDQKVEGKDQELQAPSMSLPPSPSLSRAGMSPSSVGSAAASSPQQLTLPESETFEMDEECEKIVLNELPFLWKMAETQDGKVWEVSIHPPLSLS